MELRKFQERLYHLVDEDDLKQCFSILSKAVKTWEKQRDSRLLRKRYKKCKKDNTKNIFNPEDIDRRFNLLCENLMDFIHDLEGQHLTDNLDVLFSDQSKAHTKINEPLLVLTNQSKVRATELFFHELNFANLKVSAYEESTFGVDRYRIVVFDNQDLPDCPNERVKREFNEEVRLYVDKRIELMEATKAKEEEVRVLIHFGNRLDWINHNRDFTNSANSRFSLYARIKEAIDFLNSYYVEESVDL
ncbi:MAG: hypothetical protein AAF146_18825 [Bacteroidota bacterium]